MSYPVILYPKLLVDFRRKHPLPCHQLLAQESTQDAVQTRYSDDLGDRFRANAPDERAIRSGANDRGSPISTSTSGKRRLGTTSPHLTRWLLCSSLVFGLLGFNLVAVKSLRPNLQQPIRVVSLLGAAVAIAGIVGYAYKRDTNKSLSISEPESSTLHEQLPRLQRTATDTPASMTRNSQEKPHYSKQRLLDYLELLKVNLHHAVIQPIGVSDAPVGRSEDAFAFVLERYFPGRVRRQLEFPIPQSEKGRSFSTDFAVVLEEIGLYIDVEIDEPFDLKKKRPTHCIDDYHDRYRNGFFLQGNWIIIRFAEEQVVRYPKSCCREIASCVFQVTGLDKFLKPLAGEPTLQPIPQWTKKQAKALAKRNYRDTYLSLLTK